MAIIVGIAIGLLAITTLLVVITVRWLHVLIDAWQRIAIHHCGGVLSILPNKHAQSAPRLLLTQLLAGFTDSKSHP